jgi:hypothetical protein
MRKLLIGVLALNLTACSVLSELSEPPPCPGTRYYDVQICRGEKIRRDKPYIYRESAQRVEKCEQCIDMRPNCYHGIPPQCWNKYLQENR